MKRFAMLLATAALSLTLVGAGLSAAFTAQGSQTVLTDVAQTPAISVLVDGGDACHGGGGAVVTCYLWDPITVSHGTLPFDFKFRVHGADATAADVNVTAQSPFVTNVHLNQSHWDGIPMSGVVDNWAYVGGTIQYAGFDNNWLGYVGLQLVTFTITVAD